MAIQTCFHGTKSDIGKDYIQNQNVIPSRSDNPDPTKVKDLWLGDGFYLFDQDFFAFKWIVHNSKIRVKSHISTVLLSHYMILLVKVQSIRNRTFDLLNLEHKTIFDEVLIRMLKRSIPDHYIPAGKVPDGVVINYLFYELGYKDRYDIVRSVYTFNETNYSHLGNTKLGHIFQTQYCIKNTGVIREIEEFDFKESVDDYIDMWETLFPGTIPFGNPEKSIYIVNEKEYKYET